MTEIKDNIYFLVLVSVFSCSLKPQGTASASLEWKKLFENSSISEGERWVVSDKAIKFAGNIVEGDCEIFKRLQSEGIKSLEVNSQGGLASEGLCIASEMRKKNYEESIVDGVCFSSCANYLFLASPKRTIRKGLVGYHGNVTALVQQQPNLLEKYPEKIKAQIKAEKEFLMDVKVSQKLFDLSQKADKGSNDGKDYLFLIPSPETFSKFGIAKVNGVQNQELIRLLSEKGYYLFYY